MKHWNICIQYWLAVNVYKRFPSKKYRTAVTMLISSFWHGVYMGYYVCIGTAPLALIVEDVYYKLYLKGGKGKVIKSTVLLFCNYHNLIHFQYFKVLEWIHWFFRMHFLSYQAIAFLLLEVNLILHYYNSVYHAGLVLGIILYIAGLQLLKIKRNKERKLIKEDVGDRVKKIN
jgi:lysophospholipid acyltransferase 7